MREGRDGWKRCWSSGVPQVEEDMTTHCTAFSRPTPGRGLLTTVGLTTPLYAIFGNRSAAEGRSWVEQCVLGMRLCSFGVEGHLPSSRK